MRRAWFTLGGYAPLTPALLFVSVVLVGCEEGGASSRGAASASAASTPPPSSAPAASASAEPVAKPDDLPIDQLAKKLGCSGDGGACGVLAAMRACTTWEPVTPSGDARFIGRGYVVENGKQSEATVVMRARRVPTNEVGPGQLGVKIAVDEIPKNDAAHKDADRALRAFERQDTPQRANKAVAWIKERATWPEYYAMRTAGGQVYVIEQAGAYLCQGAKQKVVLVERAAKRGAASAADGRYAELYPVTW